MPNLLSSRATSDGVQIEFGGFAELEAALKKFTGPQVKRALRFAFERATTRLAAALKAGAPDAPGPPHGKKIHGQELQKDLRNSIESEAKVSGGKIDVSIFGNYYGRILEYGWLPGKRPTGRTARALRIALAPKSAFVSPKPWIVPVFQREQKDLIDEILNDLEAEVFKIFNEIGSYGGV